MKISEMFKKVQAYNELAQIMNSPKAHVWFADRPLSFIASGYAFTEYSDFRKYVRHEYVKDIADAILNSDDWQINSEKEIPNKCGKTITFEVYINND